MIIPSEELGKQGVGLVDGDGVVAWVGYFHCHAMGSCRSMLLNWFHVAMLYWFIADRLWT